tara:strand:+ start:342 stop:995 length:654 start_codon:yes stop_codon:yes gene_type:complete
MIPRIIHQVYGTFEDNVDLNDIPLYATQVSKTRQFCETHNIDYKMWGSQECRELLNKYPQYIDTYNNFREKVMRADFIRYLILFDQGGLYVDCDICPINDIDELLHKNEFFVRWNNDKKELPYNAVLGSVKNSNLYANIIQHLIQSYQEKSQMEIYNKWKGRFVFQTTGHYMLQRVLKKYPETERLDILKIYNKKGEVIQGTNPLFEDYNVSYWFKK